MKTPRKSQIKKMAPSPLSIAEKSHSHKYLFLGNMLRKIWKARMMIAGQARAQARLCPRDIEEETADIANLRYSTTGVAVRGLTNPPKNPYDDKDVEEEEIN